MSENGPKRKSDQEGQADSSSKKKSKATTPQKDEGEASKAKVPASKAAAAGASKTPQKTPAKSRERPDEDSNDDDEATTVAKKSKSNAFLEEERKYICELINLKKPANVEMLAPDGQILTYNSAVRLFTFMFDHMEKLRVQMKLEYLSDPFKAAMEVWDKFFGDNIREGEYKASMKLLQLQLQYMVEGKDNEGMIREMHAFLADRNIDHDIQDLSDRDLLNLGEAMLRMDRFVKNMAKMKDDIFKSSASADTQKKIADTDAEISECERTIERLRAEILEVEKKARDLREARSAMEVEIQDTPVIIALREMQKNGNEIAKFVADTTRGRVLDKYLAGYRMVLLKKKMDEHYARMGQSQAMNGAGHAGDD